MNENTSITCNCCGKRFLASGNTVEKDLLHVKKQWGYFSKKDGIIHDFFVCEECYDTWLENFAIQPEIKNATELL